MNESADVASTRVPGPMAARAAKPRQARSFPGTTRFAPPAKDDIVGTGEARKDLLDDVDQNHF